ncbi:hypothetical protein [Enhygromyxa salina]|uniref:Uncharacterized protein n=1 Tax=Enhygromyxa salina TaxID=215803 RepID=A0A2S9YJ61_9BACT|nr:hypothetical protein [Enhygromyxa salina]PRQ05143.1 hypothetical protein ENSA7_47720 [Enhygromyxa salina]
MRNRKETAWRKNRRFGEIHGGRTHRKLTDGIFRRLHDIERPSANDELPILIEEKSSRDFFFPLNGAETLQALHALPRKDVEAITHVWLRRARKSDYLAGELPLATFICGSGVRVITLYPWPTDRVIRFGTKRPTQRVIREYSKWGTELFQEDERWCIRFSELGLRRFFIEHLLYHEVGHHVDWYRRHWSAANAEQCEEFANQYAMARSRTATHVFNALEKARSSKM